MYEQLLCKVAKKLSICIATNPLSSYILCSCSDHSCTFCALIVRVPAAVRTSWHHYMAIMTSLCMDAMSASVVVQCLLDDVPFFFLVQ